MYQIMVRIEILNTRFRSFYDYLRSVRAEAHTQVFSCNMCTDVTSRSLGQGAKASRRHTKLRGTPKVLCTRLLSPNGSGYIEKLRNRVNNLFLIFLLFFTHGCFALPDDRDQILHAFADSADLDQQAHRGVYKGNVHLDQGSTHLIAAEALTEGDDKHQLTKAIAKGNQQFQAHYWSLTDKDKPPVHAYADSIYYYPERHLVKLIGHALVQQDNNSISAPKITFDTVHQHVITQKDSESRTTIVIHPEKHG